MRKICLLFILTCCLACEKEIAIDYRSAEPIYVAEVLLTPDDINARITTTRDVKEATADSTFVNDAIVTLRMDGSDWTDTLKSIGRGRYTLSLFAYEGKEYWVDVIINGQHHTSSSVMHGMPQVKSLDFVWLDMIYDDMLFIDLRLQDNADDNNYYFMHLYRNNVGYRWAIMDDRSNPGGELQQLFSCCTKRDIENKSNSSSVLHEGDKMRMEIRSIDRRVYDYLYSLQMMDYAGSNPIANFSDGMFGYFSAYQQVTEEKIFSIDSVH